MTTPQVPPPFDWVVTRSDGPGHRALVFTPQFAAYFDNTGWHVAVPKK